MFSQASVILFTGVCVADTPLGRHPPVLDTPTPDGHAADGTHLTGMYFC